ncbi:putative flippase AglR, partial [ANME-1 cluster archaeon GoMg2]|nr:putative flippase AglR [ANME-1 cluster archaeon GoMg2]
NIIVSLRGLILLPILTKTIGTELYGVWTQILVTISLLVSIGLLGLITAMIRFFAGEKDKDKIRQDFYAIFTLITLFSVLLASIFFVFSEPLAIAFFGGSSSITFVRLLSPIIILTTLDTIGIEFFRAFQQMKKYAGLSILQQILEIIFISYAVLSGYSLFGALLSLIVVRAFLLLLGFLFINSQIGLGRPNLNLSVLKPYLSFGLPLLPAGMAYWVINLSDRYVIGFFLGMTSVGIYAAAYNIGSVIGTFMGPISTNLFPTISNLYENNRMVELKTYLKYSLKFYLMFAIPSLFGLTVLSKSLLATLTTSEFLSAYLVVPIVALGVILFSGSVIFLNILMLLKRTKAIGLTYGVTALINLILNIFLVPLIGILGAAISTLMTFFAFTIIIRILSFKELPFEVDLTFISKSFIASIPMALVVWKLNPYGVVNILISVGIAVTIYFGFLILLRGFTKDEYGFLRQFIRI